MGPTHLMLLSDKEREREREPAWLAAAEIPILKLSTEGGFAIEEQ